MNNQSQVLCLMGPTASGKTALALQLAQHYPCQIISVDSVMVYRGLDIGAAKPTADEQAIAPHRMIDLCQPWDVYSVGRFFDDVVIEINEVLRAGDVPLLVGGTMQYFHRLQQGIAVLPAADSNVRQRLELQAAEQGWAALHAELTDVDPVSAARIHQNDSQRIQRALEVWQISGRTLTDWISKKPQNHHDFCFHNAILWPSERKWLHARIAQRFQHMHQEGLVDEVSKLLKCDQIHTDLPALRSVGYRQVIQFLQGELSQQAMIDAGIVATRQFAKRQCTWLRAWSDASFLAVNEIECPTWQHEYFKQFFDKC